MKKNIEHENYKDVLFNNDKCCIKGKSLEVKNHQLRSYEINKISLSCF